MLFSSFINIYSFVAGTKALYIEGSLYYLRHWRIKVSVLQSAENFLWESGFLES